MANHQITTELYHICRARQAELAGVCSAKDEPETINIFVLKRWWLQLRQKIEEVQGRND